MRSVRPSFEESLHYLRSRDPFGYMTVLGMPAAEAADWAHLWSYVRYVDDLSDCRDDATVAKTAKELQKYLVAVFPRMEEELQEFANSTQVEASLYPHRAVATLDDYFQVLYYRGVLPVYLCGGIGLPGEPREYLKTFAMYLGYGGVILDDTLDLLADLEQGRIYVTREELQMFDLTSGSPESLKAFTRLRNKWALHYYLKAHRAAGLFLPVNRRLARSWVGIGLRLLLDDRIVPLSPQILRDRRLFLGHFGAYLETIDLPFPSELFRYEFFHAIVSHIARTGAFVDVEAAYQRYDLESTPLPKEFIVEHFPGREWRPVDLPWIVAETTALPLIHYGRGAIARTVWGLAETLFEPRQNP